MTSRPYFHEASGTVRFWVLIDGEEVGAMIGKETLHYRYRSTAMDDLPLDTFALHTDELERRCVGVFLPAPSCRWCCASSIS